MKTRATICGATAVATATVLAAVPWLAGRGLHACNEVVSIVSMPLVYPGVFLSMWLCGDWLTPPKETIQFGIFIGVVFNMILGAFYGFLWESAPRVATSPVTRAGRIRALVLRLWPILLPLVFCAFYRRFDQAVTVKLLGCGCSFGFNDNCVNELMRCIVLAVSVGLLTWNVAQLSAKRRLLVLFLGVMATATASHFFGRILWL